MTYLFILSTISCLSDIFASIIVKFITIWCLSESSEDQAIRRNLLALKKEMNSISMVDEFSRYAKLQRKYKKLEGEAKEKLSGRSSSRVKLRLSLMYGVRVLNGFFTMVLLYMYRKEPVIIFPSGSFWPLEPYLSWPAPIDNCISLSTWIILMKLSVPAYHRLSMS